MIIPLGKWFERFKFVLIFLLLTTFFYFAGEAFRGWLDSDVHYGPPQGDAAKVAHLQVDQPPVDVSSFVERLRLFYKIGE